MTQPLSDAKSPDTDAPLPQGVRWMRIWDPALRLFHWALAAAVIVAWGLGRFGPSIMTIHFYLGYAVIGLLAFRLIWGFVGPQSARFSHFIFGPRTTARYVATLGARRPSYWPGHNPVGALSVFAVLFLLLAQVATGLIADPDDYINVGPLAHWVGYDWSRWANGWHYRLSLGVLGVVALHVAAIVFYRIWKREDLVTPMLTGRKAVKTDANTPSDA